MLDAAWFNTVSFADGMVVTASTADTLLQLISRCKASQLSLAAVGSVLWRASLVWVTCLLRLEEIMIIKAGSLEFNTIREGCPASGFPVVKLRINNGYNE